MERVAVQEPPLTFFVSSHELFPHPWLKIRDDSCFGTASGYGSFVLSFSDRCLDLSFIFSIGWCFSFKQSIRYNLYKTVKRWNKE
jgi:hypothetical protein